MQSKPRGVCVIIDCVGTEGGEELRFVLYYLLLDYKQVQRLNTFLPTARLGRLFSSLHFCVSLHMLLSVSEVLSCLQHISRQTEHYSMDAFACCIISRSHTSQLLATDSYSPGLNLNTIRRFFTPNTCPGLTGKPKLFFIQGYDISESSNFEDGELVTDSPVCNRYRVEDLPEDADVFWSHCWTNEKQLEDVDHHSVYLQSLQEALADGQKR